MNTRKQRVIFGLWWGSLLGLALSIVSASSNRRGYYAPLIDQCHLWEGPQFGSTAVPSEVIWSDASYCMNFTYSRSANHENMEVYFLMLAFACMGAIIGYFSADAQRQVDDDDFSDVEEEVPPLPAPEENEHERRLQEVGFDGDIPEAFLDPVSKSIMFNPVILITNDHSTSQSIDESSALLIMQSQAKPACPLTGRPFSDYILNRDLKNMIQTWVDKTIAEQTKANWFELPKEESKKRMLAAQRFFAQRHPNPAMTEEAHRKFVRFSQ